MRSRLARYAHRAAPKPGEIWHEVKRTRRRRHRRIIRIIEVNATHAYVRNVRTNYPSWILLTEFTHGVIRGWRRYHKEVEADDRE